AQQYIKLVTLFPRKSFIIICWEQAGKPAGKFAKDIEYMVDIVVHVHDFKAKCRSRFGGNQDFVIWDKKPRVGDQLKLDQPKYDKDYNDRDDDDDEFEACSECDGHDACVDFGCAVKAGLGHLVKSNGLTS
ncbi:MAG: hypothetical protein ACK5SL_15770, partial [Cyclobacteriaceae bacterium]